MWFGDEVYGMGHVRDVSVELFMVPFNKKKKESGSKKFFKCLFFMLIVSELVLGEAVGYTVGFLE